MGFQRAVSRTGAERKLGINAQSIMTVISKGGGGGGGGGREKRYPEHDTTVHDYLIYILELFS